MESKLTALFSLILFVLLTVIGGLLRYVLDWDFSMVHWMSYQFLTFFLVLFLGKPVVKVGLDLVGVAYRENQEKFPVPGEELPETTEAKAKAIKRAQEKRQAHHNQAKKKGKK